MIDLSKAVAMARARTDKELGDFSAAYRAFERLKGKCMTYENTTASGYQCGNCGLWVPANQCHTCGTQESGPYQLGRYTFFPTPLTADEVRRIVREEIERANNK